MLSRVAESMYWMGRYLERAENIARLLEACQHLSLDNMDDAWSSLVAITDDQAYFAANYGLPTPDAVSRFLAFDRHYPHSIISCLDSARENARIARDTLTIDMWEQINSTRTLASEAAASYCGGAIEWSFYRAVRHAVQLVDGMALHAMPHNESWHFRQVGQLLERADKTTRILDVQSFMGQDFEGPSSERTWRALLISVGGLESYRERYGLVYPEHVTSYLLFDTEFPRSVSFCLSNALASLRAIAQGPGNSISCEAERLLGMLSATFHYADPAAFMKNGLHDFIDDVQKGLNDIDSELSKSFFLTTEKNPDIADAQAGADQ